MLVPVPSCPPQIPHWLSWRRTPASAIRSQQLPAWSMVQPYFM